MGIRRPTEHRIVQPRLIGPLGMMWRWTDDPIRAGRIAEMPTESTGVGPQGIQTVVAVAERDPEFAIARLTQMIPLGRSARGRNTAADHASQTADQLLLILVETHGIRPSLLASTVGLRPSALSMRLRRGRSRRGTHNPESRKSDVDQEGEGGASESENRELSSA